MNTGGQNFGGSGSGYGYGYGYGYSYTEGVTISMFYGNLNF
jgi:hypothetical protein